MKNYFFKTVLFVFSLSLLLLFNNAKYVAIAGEPIAGAEIYVELDPEDEPCFPVGNTAEQFYKLSPREKATDHTISKATVCFKNVQFKIPPTLTSKTASELLVTYNVDLKLDGKLIKSCLLKLRLSHIKANLLTKYPLPSFIGVIVPKGTQVMSTQSFSSVNIYGINDDGIK